MSADKTTRQKMEDIHDALVDALAARVTSAAEKKEPLPAAEITAIAKFLKDNNITALIGKSPAGKNLLKALPFAVGEQEQE